MRKASLYSRIRWSGYSFSIGLLALATSASAAKISSADVNLNGYLDTSYQFNSNRPPAGLSNNYRAYDRSHHAFELNQARVGAAYDSDKLAAEIQVGAGTQLDSLNANDTGAVSNIRKAMFTWKAGQSVSLTGGRYDANFGMERIDSVDNWNYSRSLQFFSTNPKIFNGLKLGYQFNQDWMGEVGVANGSDRTSDNNRAKTFQLALAYAGDATKAKFSYVAGSEQPTGNYFWDHTWGFSIKHMMAKDKGVGFDGSYKFMPSTLVSSATRKNANQFGGAFYGMTSCMPDHWTSLRLEYFRDVKGALTQLDTSAHLWGVTATHRYNATENLGLWVEARWDGSNRDAFTDRRAVKDAHHQVTGLLGATISI